MSVPSLQRIKNRIEYHGNAEDIEELCLDGIQFSNFTTEINQEIQKCTNLQYLTINECGLLSFTEFPNLPRLIALQAIGNKLKSADLLYLKQMKNLSFLSLDSNEIEKREFIQALKDLPQLQHLEINNNPLPEDQNLRDYIFQEIPTLRIFNGKDHFGDEEVIYDTDEQTNSYGSQADSQEFDEEENIRKIRRI